jgi:hypothetical protein
MDKRQRIVIIGFLVMSLLVMSMAISNCGPTRPPAGQVKGTVIQAPVDVAVTYPGDLRIGGDIHFSVAEDGKILQKDFTIYLVNKDDNLLSSPTAAADDAGTFLFEEVPRGKYSLVVFIMPQGSMAFMPYAYPLLDQSGSIIVFDLTSENGIDLGSVTIKIEK